MRDVTNDAVKESKSFIESLANNSFTSSRKTSPLVVSNLISEISLRRSSIFMEKKTSKEDVEKDLIAHPKCKESSGSTSLSLANDFLHFFFKLNTHFIYVIFSYIIDDDKKNSLK